MWRRCVRSDSDPGRARVTPPMGFGTFRRTAVRSLRAGLPRQRLPLPGFLTLSAVSSRSCLVAVFHATAVHRLQTSRAFSIRPAVAPLDTLCSRAVRAYVTPSRRRRHARDFRALLRPDSRTLADVARTSTSRCSPGLFASSRSTGGQRRPFSLPSRACRKTGAPQGLERTPPGRGSGESRQPPRGFSPHLTPRPVRTRDASLARQRYIGVKPYQVRSGFKQCSSPCTRRYLASASSRYGQEAPKGLRLPEGSRTSVPRRT